MKTVDWIHVVAWRIKHLNNTQNDYIYVWFWLQKKLNIVKRAIKNFKLKSSLEERKLSQPAAKTLT